jgi:NAD(P) transhydrogenase subunit alpha
MMVLELYIFVLAAFTGYMVISRVPPLLHTPLMAATNAISGISLVGSLIMAGAQHSRLATLLGFIAVVCATTNIVGGFLIVDRMLRMFQRTRREAGSGKSEADERRRAPRRATDVPA